MNIRVFDVLERCSLHIDYCLRSNLSAYMCILSRKVVSCILRIPNWLSWNILSKHLQIYLTFTTLYMITDYACTQILNRNCWIFLYKRSIYKPARNQFRRVQEVNCAHVGNATNYNTVERRPESYLRSQTNLCWVICDNLHQNREFVHSEIRDRIRRKFSVGFQYRPFCTEKENSSWVVCETYMNVGWWGIM